MTVYTIIAYKPNGVDSVMGCVQDRVDSDFDIEIFYDAELAAESVAKMSMEPDHSKYMSHSWEITILFDGMEEYEFRWGYDPDGTATEEIAENVEIIENFNALITVKKKDIEDEHKAKAKAIAEEKKAEADKKRKAAQKAKEKADRAQYEALKAKFEV